MAYVPGYERDVFVSYAHVDNEPLPGVDQGWVSVLVQSIQKVVDRKLGRKDACSLWMDWKVSKHEPFANQIVDAVCKTATLLVILSPGYLASQWCEQELNAFREIISRRGRSDIFVVELEPLGDDRPAAFDGLLAYPFWVQPAEKRFPRILGFPKPDGSEREYYSMLDELCHDIAAALKNLKGNGDGDGNDGPRPPGPGLSDRDSPQERLKKTVFLAATTDDLWTDRKSVRDYLDQVGIEVAPRRLYPQDAQGFRAAMERDLERCDLFVQLLSDAPGRMPDGVPQGYPKLQYELAQAAHKPILQWRSPTLDLDAVDVALVRDLLQGPTVRAEPIADFKTKIHKTILSTEEEDQLDPMVDSFIFVNWQPEDKNFAETVLQALDELGVDVVWTPEIEDARERREFLEQTLSSCDGMILIHGNSPGSWVLSQLMQGRKALALRHSRKLMGVVVCRFSPQRKEEVTIGLQDVQVIDCSQGCSPQDLHVYLKELGAAARA